jgi:hypothetical protein
VWIHPKQTRSIATSEKYANKRNIQPIIQARNPFSLLQQNNNETNTSLSQKSIINTEQSSRKLPITRSDVFTEVTRRKKINGSFPISNPQTETKKSNFKVTMGSFGNLSNQNAINQAELQQQQEQEKKLRIKTERQQQKQPQQKEHQQRLLERQKQLQIKQQELQQQREQLEDKLKQEQQQQKSQQNQEKQQILFQKIQELRETQQIQLQKIEQIKKNIIRTSVNPVVESLIKKVENTAAQAKAAAEAKAAANAKAASKANRKQSPTKSLESTSQLQQVFQNDDDNWSITWDLASSVNKELKRNLSKEYTNPEIIGKILNKYAAWQTTLPKNVRKYTPEQINIKKEYNKFSKKYPISNYSNFITSLNTTTLNKNAQLSTEKNSGNSLREKSADEAKNAIIKKFYSSINKIKSTGKNELNMLSKQINSNWDIISKEIPNRSLDLFKNYLNAKEELDKKKIGPGPAIETINRNKAETTQESKSVFNRVGNFFSSINPLRKTGPEYTQLN